MINGVLTKKELAKINSGRMKSETYKGRRGMWLGTKFFKYDRRMIPTAKKLYEANVLTKKDMQDFGFLRKRVKR